SVRSLATRIFPLSLHDALPISVVSYPDVTHDKLLTAVFGGVFIGAGIGLAIRGGAVLDGTEIAALLVSKNSHLLRVGDVILILRSEEHTSELQSRENIVCRLPL